MRHEQLDQHTLRGPWSLAGSPAATSLLRTGPQAEFGRLPLVRWSGWGSPAAARFRCVPQGGVGSVLIALERALPGSDRVGSARSSEAPEALAMLLDAQSGAWLETGLYRDGESAPRPTAALATDRSVPAGGRALARVFEVPSETATGTLADEEIARLPRAALGIDPDTGLLRLDDLGGTPRGIFRLRSRRPRQAPGREAVLEALGLSSFAVGQPATVESSDRLRCTWRPVAALAGNERWLFVQIRMPGIPFAIAAGDRRDAQAARALGGSDVDPMAA